jgi:hypothetical protein
LQRIVDSPGSTPEEIVGARAELHTLLSDPLMPAVPTVEGDFVMNRYFEKILAAGPYYGTRYLDCSASRMTLRPGLSRITAVGLQMAIVCLIEGSNV